MNIDINNASIVPFSVNQDTVNKSFLLWSNNIRETPLDILQNSKLIEINKIYYPIRFFHDISYNAKWEATSIWEHREEYTEYRTEIVYINENGTECYSASSARSYSNKNFVPQAVPKIEPVTKYKTIVDRTKITNGAIENSAESSYINNQKNSSEKFRNWTTDIAKLKSNKGDDEQINDDCLVYDLCGDDESAFITIKDSLQQEAKILCQKEVPGNRYNDFRITEFNCNYSVDIILIPLYEIKYNYNNKEYVYYANGTNLNDTFSENYPIDNEYLTIDSNLVNEIKQLSNVIKILSILTKIIFPIIIVLGLILMVIPIFDSGEILAGGCGLAEIICLLLLKQNNKKIDTYQKKLKSLRNERENSRYNFNKFNKKEF